MNSLCVCTLWWHHCSFRRFVQQLITHLKSRAAATSHSSPSCCVLLPRWREKKQPTTKKKETLLHTRWKQPKASFSERHVVLFLGLCVILCDFLWIGTAAAADNWNKESKEDEKFLPEADSTREEKQRFVISLHCYCTNMACVASSVIYKTLCIPKVLRANWCCPNSSPSLKNSDPKWFSWRAWRNTSRYWPNTAIPNTCCFSFVS